MAIIRIDEAKSARMPHLAENGAQERALARTVGADNCGEFPAVKMEIDMRKDLERPKGDAEVLDFGTAEMRAALRCSSVMKDMPEHGDPFF